VERGALLPEQWHRRLGDHTGSAAPQLAVNRWIIGEVVETVAALDKAMADLRFDAAANAIYHFVWDTFCDWYIELIKGSFDDETKPSPAGCSTRSWSCSTRSCPS
jgi:valyl-tRNA synthetase